MFAQPSEDIPEQPSKRLDPLLAQYGVDALLGMENGLIAMRRAERNRETLASLLKDPENYQSINTRIELLKPLEEILKNFTRHGVERVVKKANPILIPVLYEEWPDELKRYALEYLLTNQEMTSPEELREKLKFISEYVPKEVLECDNIAQLKRIELLEARPTFLESLSRYMTHEQIKGMFLDPVQQALFTRIHSGSKVSGYHSDKLQQESLLIDAEEGLENQAREVEDILSVTGMQQIVVPITKKIRIVEPHNENDAWGLAGNVYGHYPAFREIHVRAGANKKNQLFPILIHEIGHNFDFSVRPSPNAQEWRDRFAVLIALNPSYSSYAKSYLYTKKGLGKYINESFAEEFLLFFLKPGSMMPERRKLLEEMFKTQFPDVNTELIHKKILQVLGNYYATNAEAALQSSDEENAKRYARYFDRIEQETNRDQVSRIIAEMTIEELQQALQVLHDKGLAEIQNFNRVRKLYNLVMSRSVSATETINKLKSALQELNLE